ncbi:N-6 DNA methylase [Bacteroides sp.]|uniref:N-6 DNA methylase n=1 Tax=Bacteroides sp. TaxID=29523 RepID=UPI0026135CFA|nr:N-6 DNA methylase [Bacteroides sp.]MDD3040999.1 N-6 DNA methylase [Bacteroides sp.]
MNYPNNKHEQIIHTCFDELKLSFSQEQSFHIILGVSAITWINMNEEYSSSNLKIDKFLEGHRCIEVMQHELKNFEYEFYEFNGILTGILHRTFIYEDRSAEEKLKRIFNLVGDKRFSSVDEVRNFINRLTSIGSLICGFNETPDGIKKIIPGLIDFNNVTTFADYCSGTSGIALEIFQHIKENYINDDVYYYGEEINATNYLISKLLMIVNKIKNHRVVNKDVLMFSGDDVDRKFDLVISDIPQITFSDRYLEVNDPRLRYGIPARNSADWAFCQNVVYHLNNTGKGIVIGTKGTLVRSNEADIRRRILEDDLIECVITLPVNLYEKSTIGTELIIFNKNKTGDRRNRILFINASEYNYRLNRNQHTISPEGIKKIIESYIYGVEEGHFSIFADIEKIKEYNYTLNPTEYLDFDLLKNSFSNSIGLKEVAQITRGVQLSKEDLEQLSRERTHYFINVKDIENGRICYDEESMLTNKKNDWIGKYDIKPDDIILTSKGSSVKIAIVDDDYRPAFISGNLTRIRVNPKKYNAYVLYEFLQSDIGVKMIEGLQTGTTIKLLNTPQLERLEIPLFEMEYMNDIGDEIKNNKIEYEKTLEYAKEKFNYRRDKLMESLQLK